MGAQRLVMVVFDSAHNRAALRAAEATLRASLPLGTRAVMASLASGRDPGSDGLVVMRIPHPT